jgi:hypothetical protein
MQKCFASRQYNLTDSELFEGGQMFFQHVDGNLFFILVGFPDVAHNTPAVAAAVRHHYNNREIINSMGSEVEEPAEH